MPTFYQCNLTMLGKVCLRRNDFLSFQTEHELKSQMWRVRLDYLPVLSVSIANNSEFWRQGIVSSYVEDW